LVGGAEPGGAGHEDETKKSGVFVHFWSYAPL
jgi:hypothetical protein